MLALSLASSACVGEIVDGAARPRGFQDPREPVPAMCVDAPRELDVPMRRLTPLEQQAALRAIFGDAVPDVTALLPIPTPGYSYSTFADAHRVGEAEAEALLEAAEEVAIALAPSLPTCDGVALDACARETITPWIEGAFRRPAERADVERLVGLVTSAATDGLPSQEALAVAIVALLQEPRFLYVVESRPGVARWSLDAHERAQRLALTYLGAPPDALLLAAAEDGSLASEEGMRAHGERVARGDGARETFQRFVREWLGVAVLPYVHEPAVRDALDEELRRLIDDAWIAEDGFAALVTSDAAYVDSVLEAFYGLPSESSGPGDFRRVTMPGRRVGLLTHPLVLAAASHGEQSSPILRGKLIRTRLLCGALPPPPADAAANEPMLPATATARERYEARIAITRCSGCHLLLDPVGFGLEAYDGLGRFRTELGGREIDAAGQLIDAGDATGSFSGAAELAGMLVASDDASRCFTRQWTEYAMGRPIGADAACTAGDLGAEFLASGRSMPALFESLATHPAFVDRGTEVSP